MSSALYNTGQFNCSSVTERFKNIPRTVVTAIAAIERLKFRFKLEFFIFNF
jgi:hypothetical protein